MYFIMILSSFWVNIILRIREVINENVVASTVKGRHYNIMYNINIIGTL